jgi:hypothetical protein
MRIAKDEDEQKRPWSSTRGSWSGLRSGASKRVFEGQRHLLQMVFSPIELISLDSTGFLIRAFTARRYS